VFKRSTDILVDTTPEKISALIEINRNIAAGLMRQPKAAESKTPETPPAATDPTDNLI